MSEEHFVARIEALGVLQHELAALVREGHWRQAAEIAGALEIDLDALRASLRERHRAERAAVRKSTKPRAPLRAWAARRRSERPIAG